eukprot:986805_1
MAANPANQPLRILLKEVDFHNNQTYCYTPGDQRHIKISRSWTDLISNYIRERIENVYDFIDKLTAIAEYDNTVVDTHNGTVKLFNYGFHDKLHNEVLYAVAIANETAGKQNAQCVMKNTMYTQRRICHMYNLKAYQCPQSWYHHNNIMHITSKVNDVFLSMWQQIIHKTRWHNMTIFHPMRTECYNKRRLTFSITETEFIDAVQRFLRNERNTKPLIPIIMFATAECDGYRVEHIKMVRIREDNAIYVGISFVYNHLENTIQPTGIHLNKNSILQQHQLAHPHHNCDCLDSFQQIIDDFHIGNPDNVINQMED